jgi:hypothetical protein
MGMYRDQLQLVTDAGLRVTELETGYLARPRALSYSYLGMASKS